MDLHESSPQTRTDKKSKAHREAEAFGALSNEKLLELYAALLKPRLIEERMLLLLRQGKISKWFSGIGQEAISVGAAFAMERNEFLLPLHRNLGVFTTRNVPLERLFAQFQGKESGFTKGRDRSFHFGTQEYNIVGMISHLGPQLCVAAGIALASKLRSEGKATLVFTGEGGTSQGDFHEALNVASVWDLPVIFVIENNGYGLSTPVSEQFRCERLADRGSGYGIEAVQIDGNDVLEVFKTIDTFAKSIRERPRPVLVECLTFRMRGHEEASGVKYVPPELFETWAKKDPILRFDKVLADQGVLTDSIRKGIRAAIEAEIGSSVEAAFALPDVVADTDAELADVFLPVTTCPRKPKSSATSKKRFVDAVSDGLRLALREHSNLIFMGQDVAEYGGVFKVSQGFLEEFGRERIRNTPLCESAIIGAAFGLSVKGMKSVVEMQFADFVSSGFNQVVNNLAKSHYRWGQNADVVIRMPTGAGSGAGPFHSQSNEAWFFHTPGLKVVYPAFPADAKGLLIAAIDDPNPVLYFEHKSLYRSVEGEVPDEYFSTEIGKANLVREGDALSVVSYGMGVHWAIEALNGMPEVSADLLDLRTLSPLDYDAISKTVKKTGRVIVVHEDTLLGGIGGEIAAWIAEHCFELLDAPVQRCASLDTPVPFSSSLEKNFLGKSRLRDKILKLLKY